LKFVTVLCGNQAAASSATRLELQTIVGGTPVQHRFFPKFLAPTNLQANQYGTSEAVRIYADRGTEVTILPFDPTDDNCFVTLSRFLSPV
jgi:hypothetical protein